MKSISLFGILLLGAVVTASHAQTPQLSYPSNAHVERIQQEIGRFAGLRADVQAIVLRRQLVQSWDDEAWVDNTRTTYDYNGDRQTISLTEIWDGDSWENANRTVTAYGGEQVTSTQYETWNGTAWVPDYRSLYAYSGDTFSEIRYQVYVDGAWVDEDRTTITMSNGTVVATETETWDGEEWVPAERFSIEQQGADVVAVSEEWDGSEWMNVDRSVYPGITVEELFQFLQEFALEDEETSYGFAILLRFPDSIHQEWDGTGWVNVSRQVTERDASNRPVAVRLESWEDGAWVGDARYVATYNDEGRIAVLEWQMFADDWMPFLVETHFYDDAGLLERILTQYDFGSGLVNASQYHFEWMNTTTAVEGAEMPERIRLAAPYPNPFNPQSTVRYSLASPEHATLRVFDATGRLVATLLDGVQPAGDHEVVFDARGLPSGMYMIRLQTATHAETRSVTLLR